jgi:O-antigen/teichoic acid export membrane protein
MRRPWLFAGYNLLGFATAAGLGLWLVLVLDQGVGGLLVSMVASNLMLATFGVVAMLQVAEPGLSSPGLREAARFSLRAVPSAAIGTAGSILDRVLLGLFTNLETLGIYSVASRFVDIIAALHNALKMAYGPFVMKNMAAGGTIGPALVVAVTPYYTIPYAVVAVGLSIFIGPVIHLIGRPAYFDVIGIVPWLAGVQLLLCLPAYYGSGIVLGKRSDLLTIPAGAHVAVIAVLSVLLIGPFQIAGIVASRYGGAIVFVALTLFLSQRVFPMDHRWRVLAQLAIAAIVVSVAGHLATSAGGIGLAVGIGAWLGYLLLAWWIVTHGRPGEGLQSASSTEP